MIMILTPPYYTQLQTGNASAQSSVQTDIQGSGNVSTHIEVEANGQKKVLDANSPGTYNLSIQSNNNGDAKPTVSSIASRESELKPKIAKKSEIKPIFLSIFVKDIEDFINKIFSNFR
jgi:predicted RNA-binding protein with RPS1 domain